MATYRPWNTDVGVELSHQLQLNQIPDYVNFSASLIPQGEYKPSISKDLLKLTMPSSTFGERKIPNLAPLYKSPFERSNILKDGINNKNLNLSKGLIGQTTSQKESNPFGKTLAGNPFIQSAPQLVDSGLQALGSKKADNISGGEAAFSKLSDVAWSGALKTGNPLAIAGAGILKGVDLLNQFGGTTAKKQETSDMNLTGYQTQINSMAGKKNTLLGTWNNKTKNADNLTNQYNTRNTLASSSTFENNQLLKTRGDLAKRKNSQNQNALLGGLQSNALVAKLGGRLHLRNIAAKAMYKKGGKILKEKEQEESSSINVIPSGALHAHKHNLDLDVTKKGIPVITLEEGGDIEQHAEIERDEIILHISLSKKLEELHKKYEEAEGKEKTKLALEAGKLLTFEILENTEDNTGLMDKIE